MSDEIITDVNAEGFDASKLNDKTLNTLKEDSTAKIEPEQLEPAQPAAPSEKKEDQPQPATPPAEPQPSKEPAKEEILLAGKYKTVDDLGKGLTELAKLLNYNPKLIETTIALAKKTGDTAALEQAYKDLYGAQVNRQRAAEPAQPSAPDQPDQPPMTPQELAVKERKVIAEETARQFANHPIMEEMRRKGYEFPSSQEDFDTLKAVDPYLAIKFEMEFNALASKVQKEIRDYLDADAKVESHNNAQIESAKKEIAEVAKQYGLKAVDEAKIQAIIEAAMKTDFPFEDRSGVKYLRDKGILRYFYAEEFPELAKAIKLNGELNGRTQHAEDLRTMHEKGLQSLAQSATPGSKPVKKLEPVDVNDDQTLSSLGLDELKKLRDEGVPKS